MAWNTPGSSGPGNGGGNGNDNPNPWPPRRKKPGNPLDELLARLRQLFDGKGGWWRWLAIVVVVLLLFSSFKLIGEQQRGVVLRFGRFARIMQPGPNFKWPWPVEMVKKIDATSVRTFGNTVPVLTNDENIVIVSLNVQYQVADAKEYAFGTRDADEVLKQAAQSALREQVGRAPLDTVLGARGPLAAAAKERLQESLNAYHTGLVVTELNLPDARPPEEVKPAFDEVNSAQQVKDRLVNEANAYAAQVVPEARGEAAKRRAGAEGYRQSIVAKAEGDASRYSQIYAEYKAAPEVTRKRLWLETVQQVLAQNRKVVGGDGKQLIYVPMPAAAPAQQASPQASSSPPPPAPTQPLPATVLPTLDATMQDDSTQNGGNARPTRPTTRE